MPKNASINKVLIIGAGPATIGQGAEFDYSGTQACKAFKELGIKAVVVSSNPADVMTDTDLADATYILPLNTRSIEKIIIKEKPDAILATVGGQTAFNICAELGRHGVLKKYDIQLIGTNLNAIICSEDKAELKNTLTKLNIDILKSDTAYKADDAVYIAERLGYPVAVRPAYTTGGEGSGIAYNVEELRTLSSRGISASLTGQILIEQAALGWQELELEIIRDSKNNIITVCGIENIDGMGIHSGDSVCCIPMLTVSASVQSRMEKTARIIAEELKIAGSLNIQYAYNKSADYLAVIDITPCLSRSSVFASKATGVQIAKLSAMLAAGITLDEIKTSTGEALKSYKPTFKHITVKFPKWDFAKLKNSIDLLGTQMKSTGEAIGIGKTYKVALQKAVISLNSSGFEAEKQYSDKTAEKLLATLRLPTSKRHFIIYNLLKMGADSSSISEITSIDSYYINELKELAQLEEQMAAFKGGKLPDKLLTEAKQSGFSDKYIAKVINSTEQAIRRQRSEQKLIAGINAVIAGEQQGREYLYSTYNTDSSLTAVASKNKKLVVLASGYSAIGQGTEFDNSVVNASKAFKKQGFETIIINCTAGAVSTDYEISDKLYIEPLTAENILNICEAEKPYGIITQFAGENAPRLAAELITAGAPVTDSYVNRLSFSDNFDSFIKTAEKLNIPIYPSAKAESLGDAINAANEIGYPVIASINSSCGEKAVKIIHSQQDLEGILKPMLEDKKGIAVISKFYAHATAAEADVLSDGENIFIPAISEHIELAGIHSGDSAAVIPSVNIPQKHIDTIKHYSELIAKALNVCGLCSLQYSIAGDTVYLAEASLYASRSVPLAAKVCGINMAEAAAEIIARKINGCKYDICALTCENITHYGVKEAVFPFGMFPEVDPALSPEMRSTGAVLGLADSFGLAFFRAQEAAQASIPLTGRVLISVNNEDKHEALIAANAFKHMGFEVLATSGTHRWLKENGVNSTYIYKLNEGRPNILDEIINGKIDIIINTPATTQGLNDDSYIRKAAIKNKVFYMTTMAAAIAAVKGINAVRGTTHFIAKSLQEYHNNIK